MGDEQFWLADVCWGQQNRVAKAVCGAKKKRALRLAFFLIERVCVSPYFLMLGLSG